jgi:hypothetical protein
VFYDFIRGLLAYGVNERMTCVDALKHPFITGIDKRIERPFDHKSEFNDEENVVDKKMKNEFIERNREKKVLENQGRVSSSSPSFSSSSYSSQSSSHSKSRNRKLENRSSSSYRHYYNPKTKHFYSKHYSNSKTNNYSPRSYNHSSSLSYEDSDKSRSFNLTSDSCNAHSHYKKNSPSFLSYDSPHYITGNNSRNKDKYNDNSKKYVHDCDE